MLRDPRHILARASRGKHGRGETPAQSGRVEEDRGFGADELILETACPQAVFFIMLARSVSSALENADDCGLGRDRGHVRPSLHL
jgi:hypothetical protein